MTKLEKLRERGKQICDTIEKEKRNATESEEVELLGLEIAMRQEELVEGRTQRSIPLSAVRGGEAVAENGYAERGVINALADPVKYLFNGRVPVSDRTMAQYISDVITSQTMAPQDSRSMQVGVGAQGGFAAPEVWLPGFFSSVNNATVFLPRVRMYKFDGANVAHIIGWDSEDQTAGPFGGTASVWVAEGATSTAVEPKINQRTLKAVKNMTYVDVTREAGKYSENLVAELGSQMVRSVSYSFDYAILSGSGVGQPLGVLNSGSAINVSRAVAGSISYTDIVRMYKRLYPGFIAGAAWFGSPAVIGELLQMVDGANHLIWMPNNTGVANSRPGYLLGLPIFLSDKNPDLGERGDLLLADLGAYAFAISQDVILERTESARWYQDTLSFRACMMADGLPLMSNAIKPKNGGDTLSWAVVLD